MDHTYRSAGDPDEGADNGLVEGRQVLLYDLPGAAYNSAAASNASVGHLSEVQDPGFTTQYQRDSLGRVLRKSQILQGGETRSIGRATCPAKRVRPGRFCSAER